MSQFQLDPALDETEFTIYVVVNALRGAQARHRFHDPDSPRFDIDPRLMLEDRAAYDRAYAEYSKARGKYLEQHPPEPRDPLPLAPLWDALIGNPEAREYYSVPAIEPLRRENEDLYFDNFALSQRRVDEQRSPGGWLARSYFIGVPTGEMDLRCVVQEATGRQFCTEERHRRCNVPSDDDFGLVRVSGMGANYSTGERGPVVMPLYLPTAYGEWCLIASDRIGDEGEEKIIGYGDA